MWSIFGHTTISCLRHRQHCGKALRSQCVVATITHGGKATTSARRVLQAKFHSPSLDCLIFVAAVVLFIVLISLLEPLEELVDLDKSLRLSRGSLV